MLLGDIKPFDWLLIAQEMHLQYQVNHKPVHAIGPSQCKDRASVRYPEFLTKRKGACPLWKKHYVIIVVMLCYAYRRGIYAEA